MKKRHAKHEVHSRRGAGPRREGGPWPASLFDARLVGVMLAIKALVLLYGAQAYVVWSDKGLATFYDWLSIWNRWDAPHYLDIARAGYVAQGVEARWIVFYPLYPWLVRACAFILGDELVSTFFVSLPISIAVKPRQPCDAITIKSQFLDLAVSMIAL